MPIAEKQIFHISRIAKIPLSPNEPAQYSRTLTRIIAHFDRLAEVQTDTIDRPACPASNVTLGEDVAHQSLSVGEALKNAPEQKDHYFIVPRVI